MEHIYDPQLYGANKDKGLVALELQESDSGDLIELFFREDGTLRSAKEPFRPFIVAEEDCIDGCPSDPVISVLEGGGALDRKLEFKTWKACQKAKTWFSKSTGFSASAPGAPYFVVTDPLQQHLLATGRTSFLGMEYDDLVRMQVDIECTTTEGYQFCNPEREGDRIIAIAFADQSGWTEVLSGAELDEKQILERFVEIIRDRDPDIIEGHNIFNFDLPYIAARAKRHGVKLELGRNGAVPRVRPSRFSAGERSISYKRFDIYGRHVIDTLFLVHIYDISHRTLGGFGLKEVAIHFGLAADDRTYIPGAEIAAEFRRNPEEVMKYVLDDVLETRALSTLLSKSNFLQAQILPYSYQNASVRGNATKIDSLMIREYLRQGMALPLPGEARNFAGGYTDIFEEGVIDNVHHCDVRSLYPSLMLSRGIGPDRDELGVFLKMLERLRDFRFESKKKMQESGSDSERNYYDALQATFKVLINSFYGYLGFSQGHFNDFDAAEQVTAQGRELLGEMIEWLRGQDATPVEIDTDGISFVPPLSLGSGAPSDGDAKLEAFREEFQEWLPDGIEVEFDGEYRSMYSYKMKNYALLEYSGEIIIKGAALKSRGLEPFQREFLQEMIRLKLENRAGEIQGLRNEYKAALQERRWSVEKFAKTETLQDSPSTYSSKREKGKTPKRAVYELAVRAAKEYRAGDQVSYYVTGQKKSVAVHESARLVSEWDPDKRDENVLYYLGKLEALYNKFGKEHEEPEQGELF